MNSLSGIFKSIFVFEIALLARFLIYHLTSVNILAVDDFKLHTPNSLKSISKALLHGTPKAAQE